MQAETRRRVLQVVGGDKSGVGSVIDDSVGLQSGVGGSGAMITSKGSAPWRVSKAGEVWGGELGWRLTAAVQNYIYSP